MTAPKRPLSAGDRVRVRREGHKPFDGEVYAHGVYSNRFYVIEDGFYSAHEDGPFCRCELVRLRPKRKAREYWINPAYLPSEHAVTRDQQCRIVTTTIEEPGFIHVREVKVPRG